MARPVLSVASEVAPLIKTGGLADVAGALPAALAAEGWAMRTLVPGYRKVMAAAEWAEVWHWPDLFGGPGWLRQGRAAGLDLLVLDAPHLFDRPGGPYLDEGGRDWPDNPERFAALCWAAAEIGAGAVGDWRPEVIHLHDWQAGLVPVYLHARGGARPGTLITIHNVAFAGSAPADRLAALRLPGWSYTPEGLEFYGRISTLKAGLVWADRITTVSPTYARELLTPEFGMGLDGLLRARGGALCGILNGIDETAWNPATDPEIATFRSARGKAKNRAALCAEFGVSPPAGPLCIVVSRLSEQKGLDLLLAALPRLLEAGGALAVLGAGDPGIEQAFRAAAAADPGRIGVRIGYDEGLAHRMFAGADAVLVPSRFEPCGLTQMYGLRYGAVPVVARTGGLADTVIDANDAALRAGVATGVQFRTGDAGALGTALERLAELHADPAIWAQVQRNAMRHPVGWGASAPQYARLYNGIARTA